jgi:exopolysaccharide production protein ExoQ
MSNTLKNNFIHKIASVQFFGMLIVVFLMLAQTRLWPSFIGRIGENFGDSLFVLTFPIIGLLSFGLLVIHRVQNHSSIFIPLLAVMFIIWIFLTTFWSLNPGLSVDAFFVTLGVLFAGIMVGNLLSITQLQLAVILSSLVGLCASFALLLVDPSVALQFPDEGLSGGISGVYLHKNYFGLVMALSALTSYLIQIRFILVKIPVTVLFVTATFFSNASNAIWAMIFSFAIVFTYQIVVKMRKNLRKWFYLALATISGFLISAFVLFPNTFFDLIGRNPDFTGRTSIWESSWESAQTNLMVGNGWGTDTIWYLDTYISEKVNDSVGFDVSHSHQSGIELVLQSGIIGLFLLIGILVTTLILAVLKLRESQGQDNWANSMYVVSILSALLVMGMLEIPLVEERGMFLIFAFATFAATIFNISGRTSKVLFIKLS